MDLTPIRVATVDSKPWGWVDDKGQAHGNVVESIGHLIAAAAPGRPIIHMLAPVERVTHMILTGEADLAYNIIDPRLMESAVNIGSIGPLNLEVWSLKQPEPLTLEELNEARVGIALRILKNYPFIANSQLVQLSRPNRLFHMMMAGRIDAVVEFDTLLNYFAAKVGKTRDDFDILLVDKIPTYIWMSKKSPLARNRDHWQTVAQNLDMKQNFIDSQLNVNEREYKSFIANKLNSLRPHN
ncbi:MAG: hypothetical protein AseanaTS_01010 [Candidatus Pelagadaptatus aseana]